MTRAGEWTGAGDRRSSSLKPHHSSSSMKVWEGLSFSTLLTRSSLRLLLRFAFGLLRLDCRDNLEALGVKHP